MNSVKILYFVTSSENNYRGVSNLLKDGKKKFQHIHLKIISQGSDMVPEFNLPNKTVKKFPYGSKFFDGTVYMTCLCLYISHIHLKTVKTIIILNKGLSVSSLDPPPVWRFLLIQLTIHKIM